MTGIMLLTFICADCGHTGFACPSCVNTVAIDPETGLPPDVEIVNGKAVKKAEPPSEEAVRRSEQHPVCDTCVSRSIAAGKTGLLTAEERHRRFHV